MISVILIVLGIIVLLGLVSGAVALCIYKKKKSNELYDNYDNLKDGYEKTLRDTRNASCWDSQAKKDREEFIQKLTSDYEPKIKEAEQKYKDYSKKHRFSLICLIAAAALSLGFLITIPGSFHQVDAGTVAVVRELGQIVDVKTAGTYFDWYMVKQYVTYDATVQQVPIRTQAYSKDGQTMDLEVYLQYQIQLDKLIVRDENGNIKQSEGIAGRYVTLSSLQSRIETQTIEKTKAVMSSADAMTIIEKRSEYSTKVTEAVTSAIGQDYYVNVQDVVLTNIDFTDAFEKAIEDKVVAEQEKAASITRAEAELEVAKLEAQKKIEESRGNAESEKIIAKAAAEAATYKIIDLAKSIGYQVNETYNYSVTTRDEEGNIISTIEEKDSSKRVETTDVVLIGTEYTIDITTGPGATSTDASKTFNDLVISYIEYLAYLETWNGELPEIVAGEDAVSILVPGDKTNGKDS